MNSYANIRVYEEVVDQFRQFAKEQGLMQSQAFQLLLDHYASQEAPGENNSIENPILERLDQTISIIRNIEKHQTKPTLALLQMLFEEQPSRPQTKMAQNSSQIGELEDRYNLLLCQLQDLVRKIERITPTLGKPYFRIHLTDSEYRQLCTTFN